MPNVLSDSELRAIERLRLVPRRAFTGTVRGERLTTRKGVSIDFADYRNYTEGDDLRHVDWNILARLGHAVTKTYRDEEDLCIHLLIDSSASMQFGEPTKAECANRMGWALGYMALCGGDALYPRRLGSSEAPSPAIRTRQSVGRFSHWMNRPSSSGDVGLAESVERFVRSNARNGVVILISDGMDERLPAVLPTVGARGHDLMFLQILSRPELDPDVEGDLRLIDSESGRSVEITANSFAISEYRNRLAEHQLNLKQGCDRANGRTLLIEPDQDFTETVVQTLKRNGWVKS